MNTILVSGLINIETTLKVDGFPIPFTPVLYPFNRVKTTVSGVGFNIAKALSTLGDRVCLLSMIGKDPLGQLVGMVLKSQKISQRDVVSALAQTPQSVILYDPQGKRAIQVDLKDIQEQSFPPDVFERALEECSLAVLCNINFSRPFLQKARRSGRLVATDVHAISSLEDDYNRDFMGAADVLFMSDEALPCSPEEWARLVMDRYGAEILVIGLGAQGALMAVRRDHFVERVPAVFTRPVINTIGAGDALFSAFVHFYLDSRDPYESIRMASIFASYKVGASGGADGFLTERELEQYAAVS